MTQDGDSTGSDLVSSKKKGLLDLLVGPVANVATSVGTLYLYGLRGSDYGTLGKLSETEPVARIRIFLPCIASLVDTKKLKEDRQPFTPDEVSRLTDAEVEHVAEAYAATLLRGAIGDGEAGEKPQRQADEPATTYLDRLLRHEVEKEAQQRRRMREQMLAPTSSIFDAVRKSSSALGSTLSDFERLMEISAPVEMRAVRNDHFHAIDEQVARQARERAEELEMVRLTGKMTAESAKTLQDLAEAATVLLERLDERDEKADKSTRAQIRIAVWSVGVSAVLALFALILSGFSYFQDRSNSESGDRWQAELLTTIRDGNQRRAAAEMENQQLRDQVRALEAKIARLEVAQRSGPRGKSEASAVLQATSGRSTLRTP
jgi:hypothetical protein